MDVAAIRSLMRKTQASILENGFLSLDDAKHVSVASFSLPLILIFFVVIIIFRSEPGWLEKMWLTLHIVLKLWGGRL